jgi:Carbohydrate binding module (family 6)
VIFDVFHDTTDCPGLPVSAPAVLEEFKYDAATGTITPASAPILASDIAGGNFLSFSEALVDSSGNLWVTRGQTGSFTGGNLAVYPDISGTRTLDSNCPDTSWQNLGSFTSTSSNAPTSWGKSCAPYYDILQASQLGAGWGLVQGTAGGTVVMISQRGYLMPVTPSGSGTSMTFAAGEAVDIGRSQLPLPAPPPTGSFALSNRPGAIDSGGLLWFPVQTIGVGSRPPPAEVLDQWLVSVKVSKLLSPSVIALTGTSGQTTTIPADMTTTTGTTQAAGGTAHTGVTSTAFVGPANDPQSPGGFALQASDGFGVPTGNTVSYKISVPSQGSYSLAYRVFMFCNSTGTVTFTAGSTKVTTTLNTTTSGCNIGEDGTISNSTKFTLPSGTQTVTLTATTGGYYLKWFSLTRH